MNKICRIIASLSTMLLLATGVWLLVDSVSKDPELANKPEWSALQAVDAEYDKGFADRLRIIKSFGRNKVDIIGIKSTGDGSPVWILANPRIVPRVKIMPADLKFRISEAEFQKLVAEVELNEETKTLLRNAIE